MSSLRQIEANRRNARLSTGPVTDEGKVAAHDEDAAGLARATMKGFVVGLLPMVSAMIGQRLASHAQRLRR
jgi:hypothetical protein